MSVKWTRITAPVMGACLACVALAQPPSQKGLDAAAARPGLLFREAWMMPPHAGPLNDQNRRLTQAAVTNANLDLKLYGADARDIGVYVHEDRQDLWNGIVTSPIAVTLRDKNNYLDLTGLARLRWITRTWGLHVVHPVIRTADGILLVGSHTDSTDGEYLETEVAFTGLQWFRLDPDKVVTGNEVKNPDLSRVDEIGYVDLMPGGGHGWAGWVNVSSMELYAKAVPRGGATR